LAATIVTAPAQGTECACDRPAGLEGECPCQAKEPAAKAVDGLTLRRMASGPGGPPQAGPAVEAALRASGAPLPTTERAFFEPRLGHDLSKVRVHTGEDAAAAAHEVVAKAFSYGRNVVFGAGGWAPGTAAGRRLLGHELVHVVQQTGRPGDLSIQRLPEPAIQRQPCEDPAEIARGGLPRLLEARGIVGPQIPEILAEKLTYEQFEAMTGLTATKLPDSTFVGMDRIRAGGVTQGPVVLPDAGELAGPAGTAVLQVPMPIALAPDNCVGILGTRPHLSIFAKVNGRLTVVGFRGNIFTHLGSQLPGEPGLWFKQQLIEGVPGEMRGDRLFTLMGEQAVIFRETDPTTAQNFAARLREVQYGGTYRFTPPDPNAEVGTTERILAERVYRARGETQAVMCGARNCITVPIREFRSVTGTSPEVGGVDLVTGRTATGEYRPYKHGRAGLMWEYMKRPDLSGRPGLTSVTMTPAAARAVGVIRFGGYIMLLYGGYQTGKRLWEARGTERFPLVATQEALTWTGGIVGTAVGTAAVSALVCAPAGPVTLACAVGGFLGGLVVGAIGGAIGSLILPVYIRMAEELTDAIVLFIEGITTAAQIGHAFTQAFGEAIFTGLLEIRNALNPCNWELEGLTPRQKGDIWALGLYLWPKFGAANPNTLAGMLNQPVSSFAVPPKLLQDIASGLTQAARARTGFDIVFTPQFVGGITPFELVKQLKGYGLLRFKFDPRLLAEIQMLPGE